MLQHFYKYLLLHRHAGVPGVGNFSLEMKPSSIEGNAIHPPQHYIEFHPGSALTDKQFYQFLAAETGMSEVDSVRRFQDFAYQLRKDLQSHPQVDLHGLGLLKRSPTGEIAFEHVNGVQQFFAPIALKEIQKAEEFAGEEPPPAMHGIETEEETEVVKKDYWWIWAILLAVTALAIIGYFFMKGEII